MTEVAVKTYPVMEVFGPVVQGEGPLAGQVTHFVRFGLCDYRCSWCDSMFAVEPEEVKAHAERLDVSSIVERLEWLDLAPWVTLSGGNPAVHDLGPLVKELRETLGLDVAVETQGSRWRSWLRDVDHLTISPKPPSSGMAGLGHLADVDRFIRLARESGVAASLKVVVFDERDLAFALEAARRYPWLAFFISSGTDSMGREPLERTAARYRKVCELVAGDGSPEARRARVLPQLHVVAWGHALGR